MSQNEIMLQNKQTYFFFAEPAPAPVSPPQQQRPKITIITRSKAVSNAPELPEDIPSTDF